MRLCTPRKEGQLTPAPPLAEERPLLGLRALIAACTVLVAVGVLTGAVRASCDLTEARLPAGVTISR